MDWAVATRSLNSTKFREPRRNQVTTPPTRTVTIYVLADSRVTDPIARVRYVGRTVRTLARLLRDHWATANADEQTHRARWMRAVRNSGGRVVIEEVARVPYLFVEAAEIDFIARFRG